MDKRYLAIGVLAGAIAFLLLFGSGQRADAVTYRTRYSTTLSCNGPDGVPSTGDDSCTPGAQGANGLGLTADILSKFLIPLATPSHSNFRYLATFGTPSGWTLATDKQIPDGAGVGKIVSQWTLALFNGGCTNTLVLAIPMYDCSTANFEGVNDGCPAVSTAESGSACNDSVDGDNDGTVNDGCPQVGAWRDCDLDHSGTACSPAEIASYCTGNATNDDPTDDGDPIIAWDALQNGQNLLVGKKGGLPAGCTKYPSHLNAAFGGVKPRARYFGATVIAANMSPTQLQLAMFSPEELSLRPAPEASIKDEMGYVNFVNPAMPVPVGNALEEYCTPLESDTTLWGKTGGQGGLAGDITVPWTCPAGYPCATGPFWTVADTCGDGVDNDGDNQIDEMCGIQRAKNPGAAAVGAPETGTQCCNGVNEDLDNMPDDGCICGLWKTGTHMDGVYSESYYDADADDINNVEDECPYNADNGVDTETQPQPCSLYSPGDFMDSACDPNPAVCDKDQDDDFWNNQQDNCPLIATAGANGQSDYDVDGLGDVCDRGYDDDTGDADGKVNDGCPAVPGPGTTGQETAGAQCDNDLDDDADTYVNDGCAQVGATAESGAQCTDGPRKIDGLNVNDQPSGGICIGATDSDGDGFCDATENLNPNGSGVLSLASNTLVPPTPTPPWGGQNGESEAVGAGFCSDTIDNDSDTFTDVVDAGCSVPEYKALDYAVVAAANPPGAAPRTCSNWSYYDSTSVNANNGVAPQVDEDADTTVNAADANCVALANDFDQDGVSNATDNCAPIKVNDGCPRSGLYDDCDANSDGDCLDTGEVAKCADSLDSDGDTVVNDGCPKVGAASESACNDSVDDDPVDDGRIWNPTQLDTDGDGIGDACDTDDDADNIPDTVEWAAGNDAKNVCDPRNFDLNATGDITIADVTTFIQPLRVINRPCNPPVNYNVSR